MNLEFYYLLPSEVALFLLILSVSICMMYDLIVITDTKAVKTYFEVFYVAFLVFIILIPYLDGRAHGLGIVLLASLFGKAEKMICEGKWKTSLRYFQIIEGVVRIVILAHLVYINRTL